MHNLIEFTIADLDLPKTQPEILAARVLEMYDGKKPVQTLEVAKATGRNYHDETVDPLHARLRQLKALISEADDARLELGTPAATRTWSNGWTKSHGP